MGINYFPDGDAETLDHEVFPRSQYDLKISNTYIHTPQKYNKCIESSYMYTYDRGILEIHWSTFKNQKKLTKHLANWFEVLIVMNSYWGTWGIVLFSSVGWLICLLGLDSVGSSLCCVRSNTVFEDRAPVSSLSFHARSTFYKPLIFRQIISLLLATCKIKSL